MLQLSFCGNYYKPMGKVHILTMIKNSAKCPHMKARSLREENTNLCLFQENSQKINSLPPLKLPVNKLQSEVLEEKVNTKEIQQLNGENESAEMTNPTTPSTTIEATIENVMNKQDTVANNATDSMNNIKKADSPGESPKATPKKVSPTVMSNEVPSEVTSEEVPSSADQRQESKIMNGNKETKDDNEKPSMKMDAENNVQEINKP